MRNSVPQSCTCGSQCEKVLPCVLYDVISLVVVYNSSESLFSAPLYFINREESQGIRNLSTVAV